MDVSDLLPWVGDAYDKSDFDVDIGEDLCYNYKKSRKKLDCKPTLYCIMRVR